MLSTIPNLGLSLAVGPTGVPPREAAVIYHVIVLRCDLFVSVFGRAIHSLSKIGEELYIEPLDHGVRKILSSFLMVLDAFFN